VLGPGRRLPNVILVYLQRCMKQESRFACLTLVFSSGPLAVVPVANINFPSSVAC
jgi:hypothetical protein